MEFASAAARTLAAEFAGDPAAELFAWLRIAQQREGMVSEAYAPSLVDRHLHQLLATRRQDDDAMKVLRAALGSVWAQETSHDQYLASIIRVVDPPESFLEEVKERVARVRGTCPGHDHRRTHFAELD